MLKHLFLLLFSAVLLLSSPQHCTLDLAENTVEILCEDASLDLLLEYDQGEHAKGKLTRITDASGSLSFAYDAKGNIVSKTQVIDDKTFTTGYTYNAQDKLTSQTLPSGKVIGYEYSQTGELSRISIDGAPFITDITTNQNGLISYTYADGTTHSREYDTNGRVTKLIYPNYTEEVTYNAVSNVTQIKANSTSRSFDYDLVDRLISYDHNATDYQRFSYDDNGNRLSLNQEVNKSQSYLYTPNTNILEQITHTKRVDENTTEVEKQTTYTYDATGNIVADGTHTYTYDSRNRLIGVDDNITYQYNYDNKRVSKTVNGTTTYFIYDAHKLVGEYDADGNVITEYLYNGDTPIALITAEGIYKIYADHLDTPRRVADSTNAIVWSWESKPFGEDEANGTITLNLRFPGQYFDAETGTHYNINRDYNPVTGRYIQSDPIGLDGGSNTYLYANANSLRFSDPEGKDIGVIIGDRYNGSFNIAGHAAMAVSNNGVYSWGTSHKFGVSILDYLWNGKEPQVPNRNIGVYIIESSPIEDAKAIKEFFKIRNKGYSLTGGRTCATAVAAALKFGLGLNDITMTRFPAVLQRDVVKYTSYYLFFEEASKPSYIDKIMLKRFE